MLTIAYHREEKTSRANYDHALTCLRLLHFLTTPILRCPCHDLLKTCTLRELWVCDAHLYSYELDI